MLQSWKVSLYSVKSESQAISSSWAVQYDAPRWRWILSHSSACTGIQTSLPVLTVRVAQLHAWVRVSGNRDNFSQVHTPACTWLPIWPVASLHCLSQVCINIHFNLLKDREPQCHQHMWHNSQLAFNICFKKKKNLKKSLYGARIVYGIIQK